MAENYKVGNLQIAFEAINSTSEDFKKLATNLRAISKLINTIGNADLSGFTANIKNINKAFSPLLTKINSSSESLANFNGIVQKLGIKNLSKTAEEMGRITEMTEEASNSASNLVDNVNKGNQQLKQTSTALVAVSNAQEEVISQSKILNAILNANTFDKLSSSVSNLASRWKNLYATMQLGNIADQFTNGQFSPEAANRLEIITQKYLTQRAAMDKINDAFKEIEEQYRRSRLSVEELTIEEYRNVEAKKKQRIEYLQAVLALGKAGEKTLEYQQELAQLRGQITETTEEIEELNNTAKKGTNGFKKFLKSLGRIALYRTIRRAIQLITSAFQETIQAFAEVDDSVNSTMSNITSSLSVIKLSFGSLIIPLLQMVEPIIQQISVAFANFANLVGQAMSTTGKYTQINANYWEDYRKQLEKTKGSLLDFDKIRSLNSTSGVSLSDALIPDQAVDETNKNVIALRAVFERLKNTILNVWNIIQDGWEAIKPIAQIVWNMVEKYVLPAISSAVNGIKDMVSWLNEMGLLEPIIWLIVGGLVALGGYKVIGAINSLISAFTSLNAQLLVVGAVAALALMVIGSWGDMNTFQRIASVIGVLTVAVFGLALAFGALHSAWSIGAAAAAIVAGIVAVTAAVASAKSEVASTSGIRTYANGGLVPNGTLFYAGEAGAETVTVGANGRTEVTNTTQMENALYNALVRYGRENSGNGSQAININIDGQRVFEATRRTANKRGLDFSRI